MSKIVDKSDFFSQDCYQFQVDEVSLNGEKIFSELNFKFNLGEWTCIMGVSGVGKTTLLKLLAGLIPDNKSNKVIGLQGNQFIGQISYMGQNDLLLPWLTVIENVLLGQRLRREPYSFSRAQLILNEIGIGDKIHNNVATLSGGMRQRVSLARTIIEDKPIVLMDEPFSALDTINRVKMQDIAFKSLSNHTVLFVTHDPLEAFRLAHKIVILSGSPARVTEIIQPTKTPLRGVTDPNVLCEHAELLERLRTG